MRLTQTVEKSVVETTDILCDRCGDSCKGEMNFNGLVEVQISGAYDSTHLEDNAIYTFSMCEKCLVEIFQYFTFPPKKATSIPPE